jgi:hypothetical protein
MYDHFIMGFVTILYPLCIFLYLKLFTLFCLCAYNIYFIKYLNVKVRLNTLINWFQMYFYFTYKVQIVFGF